MKTIALSHRRLRTTAFTGLAIVLTWLVISRSLAAYLADVAPDKALWLNPQQPEALINLANRFINSPVSSRVLETPDQGQEQKTGAGGNTIGPASGGLPGGNDSNGQAAGDGAAAASQNLKYTFDLVGQNQTTELPKVRAWAESTLMSDPLNASALRILGQVASVTGDDAGTLKFMTAAAQESLHENTAVFWLMRKSTDEGDFKAAISYADALLRTNPDTAPYVVPVLVHFAEIKASNGSVKEILNSNPPWRHRFFEFLPRSMTDARTPLDLLMALKNSSTPPTSIEIRGYLDSLIERKFYDLAYYAWLQFLPPEALSNAGLLFNGNFESRPSGLPFDWVMTEGSGVTIDIVPRADKSDENALLLEFLYGRVEYHSVNELILLPPGIYQFDGKYQGSVSGPRGLNWKVICADVTQAPLGESDLIGGATSTWKDLEFTFTVPAANCRAQYVQLDLDARTASERLITGSLQFTELQISRVPDPTDVSDPTDTTDGPDAKDSKP